MAVKGVAPGRIVRLFGPMIPEHLRDPADVGREILHARLIVFHRSWHPLLVEPSSAAGAVFLVGLSGDVGHPGVGLSPE